MTENFYTVDEIAKKLRVSRSTVYRWLRSPHIGLRGRKFNGRGWRIPETNYESFIRSGGPLR